MVVPHFNVLPTVEERLRLRSATAVVHHSGPRGPRSNSAPIALRATTKHLVYGALTFAEVRGLWVSQRKQIDCLTSLGREVEIVVKEGTTPHGSKTGGGIGRND